jgi:methylmalonyl-CoA mutase
VTRVVDPLGGSYYVEALTAELAEAAQALIDRAEAEGGMSIAVAAGWPKAMIEESAAARQARVDRGEDVIVGVNRYRLADEAAMDVLEVDNSAVRAAQIARINSVRAKRDEAACRAALAALSRAAQNQQDSGDNLLALAVEAARVRATLGEISAAMEEAFGRHGAVPSPVSGVYGAPYADDPRWRRVVEGIEAVGRRLGRKPRILVAKLGQDGHDRGANVIASAFGDMGFDVVSGPLFQTPPEAAALALAKDVDIVGISSLAGGHKTLIPELVTHLREAGRADIKVVAGGVIPPQDYDSLREAGVQAIYGPGTNVMEAAEGLLRLLGHNLPAPGDA